MKYKKKIYKFKKKNKITNRKTYNKINNKLILIVKKLILVII